MPCFFYKEKRFRKIIAGIITFMVMISYSCPAQDNQRLPDSVSIADTVSYSEENNNKITTATDTTERYKSNADSVILRTIPDSAITAFKQDKVFKYANDPEYWIETPVK